MKSGPLNKTKKRKARKEKCVSNSPASDYIVLRASGLGKNSDKEVNFKASVSSLIDRLTILEEKNPVKYAEFRNWPRQKQYSLKVTPAKERQVVLKLGDNKKANLKEVPENFTASIFHDQSKGVSYVELKWKEDEIVERRPLNEVESILTYATRIVKEIDEARKRIYKIHSRGI